MAIRFVGGRDFSIESQFTQGYCKISGAELKSFFFFLSFLYGTKMVEKILKTKKKHVSLVENMKEGLARFFSPCKFPPLIALFVWYSVFFFLFSPSYLARAVAVFVVSCKTTSSSMCSSVP